MTAAELNRVEDAQDEHESLLSALHDSIGRLLSARAVLLAQEEPQCSSTSDLLKVSQTMLLVALWLIESSPIGKSHVTLLQSISAALTDAMEAAK